MEYPTYNVLICGAPKAGKDSFFKLLNLATQPLVQYCPYNLSIGSSTIMFQEQIKHFRFYCLDDVDLLSNISVKFDAIFLMFSFDHKEHIYQQKNIKAYLQAKYPAVHILNIFNKIDLLEKMPPQVQDPDIFFLSTQKEINVKEPIKQLFKILA